MYIKNKRGSKLSGVIIRGNNMLEILDHYLSARASRTKMQGRLIWNVGIVC
jgi:hypothetical protein